MGKLAPDAMIDGSLDYVASSDYMCVCSGSPTTYTQAYTTNLLAKVAMSSGSFTKADDTVSPYGRKVTMSAASGVPITASGDALAVALVKTGDSSLRYVTTCTQQALVSGGTVDIPAWKIQIGDPT